MSDKQTSEVTEAELADHYYAHRNDADRNRVDYVLPRAARVAVRLSSEEERRIREVARATGMTGSVFLRQVGSAAAAGRVVDVDVDRLRRDVDGARARIDDARQDLAQRCTAREPGGEGRVRRRPARRSRHAGPVSPGARD